MIEVHDWFEDKDAAVGLAQRLARILVKNGMGRSHAVSVKPFQGGWQVVVGERRNK